MKTSIAIFAFALFVVVRSTEVSQCTTGPLPDDVQIENCDKQPCAFYINTTSSMTMKFKAPRKLEHIVPNALASVMGINVTYPLDQKDACDGITNTKCPIGEGDEVVYTYGMFILPIFPPVQLTLEFSLLDRDTRNETIECFKIDIAIKK